MMPDRREKTTIAVIYIIISVLLAALVSMVAGVYTKLQETHIDSYNYLERFVETYDALLTREHDEEIRIRSDLEDLARLTVAAIKRSRKEIIPSQYVDGAIVRVTAEKIESPIDLPKEITPDAFSDKDTGTYDTAEGTMIYGHIADNLYYVEMMDPVETVETGDMTFAAEKSDVIDALEDLASAHKCSYLYMKAADDGSGDYDIYCATGQYSKCSRLSQLDISKNNMAKINDSLKDGSAHIIKIGGHRNIVRFIDVGDSKIAAMFIPLREAIKRTAEQTVLFTAGFLVISVMIASWILFIYYAVENHTISLGDRDRYRPRSVRIRIKAAVVFGALLLLISNLFTQALESAFTETNNASAILTSLFHRIENDKKRSDKLWQDSQDRYTAMADRVALLIDKNRVLQNREWLKEASKIIGAEYLMIFDTKGREVISDSPYKGLTLGKSESDATYDFRRLLRGVRSVSHPGVTDEIIGQKLDMYGIPLHFLAEDDAYGALILATDPKSSGKKSYADVNGIAESMTAEGAICFAADPKTGLIKYSSDSSLPGKKVDILGLDKSGLREDYMGFVEIKGQRCYVTSSKHDNLIYFYAVKSSKMLRYDLQYAIIVFLLSLLLLSGLAYVLMNGYREEDYMASFEGMELSSDSESGGLHPTIDEFIHDTMYSFGFLNKSASPDERTGSLLLLSIAAVLMPLVIRVYYGGNAFGAKESMLNYIGKGDWERGFNIFSVASVLLMLCQVMLILITLKFIINLAGKFIGTKGHTVTTLLYNVLLCFILIAFVLISLDHFGVNAQALITSFGLVGLAVSLGAKDLIADIIAGITLMADGSYKVGDTIEIDGKGGKVLKINMRKTTVMDWRGVVKTFSNSTITSVINHSVYPYVYVVYFILPRGCKLKKAEEIIHREMPKLVGKCPGILEGPTYKGVEEVVLDYGVTYSKLYIQALCKWGDRFTVNFFINGEMKKMFENEFDEEIKMVLPFPLEEDQN